MWPGSPLLDLTRCPGSHNVHLRRRSAPGSKTARLGSRSPSETLHSHLNRGETSARLVRPRFTSVWLACVGAARNETDLHRCSSTGKFLQVAPDAVREDLGGAPLMLENSTVCHIVDELILTRLTISLAFGLGFELTVPLVVNRFWQFLSVYRSSAGISFSASGLWVGCGVVFQRRV